MRTVLGVLCAFITAPFALLGLWMLAVEIATWINRRRSRGEGP